MLIRYNPDHILHTEECEGCENDLWKRTPHVMHNASVLGKSGIEHPREWGWKYSRQKALQGTSQKTSDFQKTDSDGTEDVLKRHNQSADETLFSKAMLYKAADGWQEPSAEERSYLLPDFVKHAFKGNFPFSRKHKLQSLMQLLGIALLRQMRGETYGFPIKICCWRIQTTVKGSCG